MLMFLFTTIIIHDNKILKVDYHNLSFQELALKESVIDYTIENDLYILTPRNIIVVDTINLRMLDQTPLPQNFNYLASGENEVFLISSSEIIILDKKNLTFKSGIGIKPGDYKPMINPARLPQKSFLYLISRNDKKVRL